MDLHHQADINVKNLTVTRGSNKEKAMRIAFHYPNKANARPQAKIKLDNVKFTDCNIREALQIMDNGLTGANDYISGKIVDKSNKTHIITPRLMKRAGVKAEPEFDYDFSKCTAKVAAPANGAMEDYPEFPLWHYATFWFYAQKDQNVQFMLKSYKKIRFAKTTNLTLIAPDGKKVNIGEISPNENKTFSFKADAAGFYKVDMRNKDLRVALMKSNVPAGIMLNNFTHRFSRNSGTLFFNVPGNAQELAVRVWGQIFSNQYYAVKAVVCDPDGKIVFSDSAIGGAVQYNAKNPVLKSGIWKISFAWPIGGQYKLGEYNLRLMGASPYIGLREDRTPILSGNFNKVK
jgi:hypothetical protein